MALPKEVVAMSESAEEIVDECIKSVFGKTMTPAESFEDAIKAHDKDWREVANDLARQLIAMTEERDALVVKVDARAAEISEANNENLALKAHISEIESSANTLSEFPAAELASTADVSDFGMVGQ